MPGCLMGGVLLVCSSVLWTSSSLCNSAVILAQCGTTPSDEVLKSA